MTDPRIAARALALIAEAKWRTERHVAAFVRLDARGRLAAFLIGIYDRLRRADLITRPTFNLHLTQDQLGDHRGLTMVHVSRTLKVIREESLAIVDRGVVIILDVERLRGVSAAELPQSRQTGTWGSAGLSPKVNQDDFRIDPSARSLSNAPPLVIAVAVL